MMNGPVGTVECFANSWSIFSRRLVLEGPGKDGFSTLSETGILILSKSLISMISYSILAG
jgi:hypothetical protein